MALKKLLADLSIISKLGTNPGIDDGLSEEQLKAKFDEAVNIIKDFLNDYLIPEMEKTVDVEALLRDILDETLTKIDKAAQAKAVGEALSKKLSLTGGSMIGQLDMSGRSILNVATPTSDSSAANKSYVDAKHVQAEVNVPVSGWTTEAPYTQSVTVDGLLESDCPHIGAIYSGDLETKMKQKEVFGYICEGTTQKNTLTLICFEDKPDVDLTLQVEVNR